MAAQTESMYPRFALEGLRAALSDTPWWRSTGPVRLARAPSSPNCATSPAVRTSSPLATASRPCRSPPCGARSDRAASGGAARRARGWQLVLRPELPLPWGTRGRRSSSRVSRRPCPRGRAGILRSRTFRPGGRTRRRNDRLPTSDGWPAPSTICRAGTTRSDGRSKRGASAPAQAVLSVYSSSPWGGPIVAAGEPSCST
jgi:hypothetical protein